MHSARQTHQEDERRGNFRTMFDIIHKIATLLIVALILWAGDSINKGTMQSALMAQRIEQLTEQVRNIAIDKYSAADAARDFALRDQRITNNERRIEAVEAGPINRRHQ